MFEEILPQLEDALSVPVFSPAEAELALARGAALASTLAVERPFIDFDDPVSGYVTLSAFCGESVAA